MSKLSDIFGFSLRQAFFSAVASAFSAAAVLAQGRNQSEVAMMAASMVAPSVMLAGVTIKDSVADPHHTGPDDNTRTAIVIPAESKPGDHMEDGTIFAGLSPDTGQKMFTTPADATGT